MWALPFLFFIFSLFFTMIYLDVHVTINQTTLEIDDNHSAYILQSCHVYLIECLPGENLQVGHKLSWRGRA